MSPRHRQLPWIMNEYAASSGGRTQAVATHNVEEEARGWVCSVQGRGGVWKGFLKVVLLELH